jgi:hypothetical protein
MSDTAKKKLEHPDAKLRVSSQLSSFLEQELGTSSPPCASGGGDGGRGAPNMNKIK